jgi:hypothetical protein
MYVYVLPVSGGGFVSQLAIIQHLCEIKFLPNIILASSGGNVAAYIAAAANWKWAAIERIARELSQDLFLCPWTQISSLSLIIGYFKGNIHNKGSGIHDFVNKHFTKENIKKYEIWTGTYNKTRQKARLFCNLNDKDSILDVSCIDHELTQSMEPLFADGDMSIIGDAGVASASIPSIVPSQKIFDEEYIDGGVASASPLSIMQEPILKYVNDNKESLHILYINSVDLSNPNIKPIHNILDTWKQTANDLIRSQTVIDRLSCYELLRCHSNKINKTEFVCSHAVLLKIKKIQSKVKYTMIEFYPTTHVEINLTKFNGNDVVNSIRESYQKCRCRFWWISSGSIDIDNEINLLLEECRQL